VVPALRNQRERLPRTGEIDGRRSAKQRPKIADVLRTADVVSGENLQGNQMRRRGNAHRQLRQQLDVVGFSDNLALDARRGKQQVDDRARRLRRPRKPYARETPDRRLLDQGFGSRACEGVG